MYLDSTWTILKVNKCYSDGKAFHASFEDIFPHCFQPSETSLPNQKLRVNNQISENAGSMKGSVLFTGQCYLKTLQNPTAVRADPRYHSSLGFITVAAPLPEQPTCFNEM